MLRISIISVILALFAVSAKAQEDDSLKMDQKPFNEGLIFSLPQAVQGQIPGLLVARPGSNPNGNFDMIYRGYHTFRNRMQPMLMLDGIPGLSWHLMDPFLIDSIGVRRGSQLAQMGLQAAAGVFDATVSRSEKEGFSLTFLQNISLENYQRPYDILSPQEFRNEAPAGTNFGRSDTDWLDAITHTAWSKNTGLKLGYKSGNLNSKVIFSQRNVEGIQKQTGFKQLSLYGAIDYSFWKNRITAGVSTLIVNRDSEIGNTDFFQAAVAMNPTFALDEQSTNFNTFGGNPLLRMNASQNTLNSKMDMVQAYITAKPIPNWTINGRIGQVGTKKNQYQYNESIVSNEGSSYERNNSRQDDRTYLEFSTDYIIKSNDFTFNPGIRFTSQKISYDQTGSSIFELFGTEYLIDEQVSPPNFGKFTIISEGIFVYSNWKEKLYFDVLYQPEASANLGENAGWGQFFGVDLKYKINSKFQIFSSFSHTGMIPDRTGLNKTFFQIKPLLEISHFANPDMKWEDTFQWEIGGSGSFLKDKLFVDLRYFTSRSSDFINLMLDSDANRYIPFTYQNFGEIRNHGTEWVIGLNPVKIGIVYYQSRINASFLKSEWMDLEAKFVSLEGLDMGGSRILGGNPLYHYSTIRTGEPIGTARAYEYLGIDSNTGQWILQGSEIQNQWIPDYVPQGQAVPRWWMGWNHQVQWNKWHLGAFFRGVFGHINANETNLFYGGVNFYNNNSLKSYQELKERGLREDNRFSSYFIEKSGFLSLHYLSISRDLNFLIRNKKVLSRISLIANNLFYITSYSAPDPEARLSTRNIRQWDDHIGVSENFYSPGIDAMSTWLPSRAFTLSYQLSF